MTFLTALETFLETENIATVGVDMFDSELPFDQDAVIALILAPSLSPNRSIPYLTQTIDIWARFAVYEHGFKKLQDIFDLFQYQENFAVPNYHIYVSFANGLIEDLGRDSERRHLFKLSLGFVYRKASDFS